MPLQFDEADPIAGRLAFQVDGILAVRSADGRHILVPGKAIGLARKFTEQLLLYHECGFRLYAQTILSLLIP